MICNMQICILCIYIYIHIVFCRVATGEGCDDGNVAAGDGCSVGCQVEEGWECAAKKGGRAGARHSVCHRAHARARGEDSTGRVRGREGPAPGAYSRTKEGGGEEGGGSSSHFAQGVPRGYKASGAASTEGPWGAGQSQPGGRRRRLRRRPRPPPIEGLEGRPAPVRMGAAVQGLQQGTHVPVPSIEELLSAESRLAPVWREPPHSLHDAGRDSVAAVSSVERGVSSWRKRMFSALLRSSLSAKLAVAHTPDRNCTASTETFFSKLSCFLTSPVASRFMFLNFSRRKPLGPAPKTVYEVALEHELLALHITTRNPEEILQQLLGMYGMLEDDSATRAQLKRLGCHRAKDCIPKILKKVYTLRAMQDLCRHALGEAGEPVLAEVFAAEAHDGGFSPAAPSSSTAVSTAVGARRSERQTCKCREGWEVGESGWCEYGVWGAEEGLRRAAAARETEREMAEMDEQLDAQCQAAMGEGGV